jgi:hypothetical protein
VSRLPLLKSAEGVALALRDRLATISTASGAETDIGTRVLLGRRSTPDETQIPCVVLLEVDDIPSKTNVRTEYHVMQGFVAMAYLRCDVNDPNTAAHQAIRDIKRALFRTDGKADDRLGGQVHELLYLGKQISPREGGQRTVVAIVEVAAAFAEDVSQP